MASSNATMDGGSNSTLFDDNTAPTGDHFKDPVLVAAIAVNGLCAVAFAILVIVHCRVKGEREKSRKIFHALAGVIFTLLLSYLRDIANEVILELNITNTDVNIAILIIRELFSVGTDSALPFILYGILQNRFSHIDIVKSHFLILKYLHLGIAVLLALFRIVDAALMSYGTIFVDINEPPVAWGISIANWYQDIHVTYAVLFCAATLEMIACAVFIFQKAKAALPSQSLSQSRIPTYLLNLILPFLLIRSLANLALGILYTYLNKPTPTSNGLTTAVVLGVPSVVLYTGLVLVGLQKDWYPPAQPSGYIEPPRRYPEPQMQHQGYGGAGAAYQYGVVMEPVSDTRRVY